MIQTVEAPSKMGFQIRELICKYNKETSLFLVEGEAWLSVKESKKLKIISYDFSRNFDPVNPDDGNTDVLWSLSSLDETITSDNPIYSYLHKCLDNVIKTFGQRISIPKETETCFLKEGLSSMAPLGASIN